MKTIDKLMMFHMAADDVEKVKQFYTDVFGFTVTNDKDYGGQRWVSMELPGGGTSINLTNVHENMKPGTLKLYLSTPDIEAAYRELTAKGALPAHGVTDDPWGKWFDLNDPEGNHWLVVQS
jgi:predicted enzyme related to lactoylglutathione lyase